MNRAEQLEDIELKLEKVMNDEADHRDACEYLSECYTRIAELNRKIAEQQLIIDTNNPKIIYNPSSRAEFDKNTRLFAKIDPAKELVKHYQQCLKTLIRERDETMNRTNELKRIVEDQYEYKDMLLKERQRVQSLPIIKVKIKNK